MTNDNDFETKNRSVNKNNDPHYQGQSIVRMVLIFDIVIFIAAGLFCLLKPEAVNHFIGLGAQTTQYLGFGLLTAAAMTAIAMHIILKKQR